ncbi:MAG: hypothetical protein GEV12_13645 [Micromonosporaceae bacterium]|nr:hypothetical protein [Micromonosporaceae bacterium]
MRPALTVVCTGRGSHARKGIGKLVDYPHGLAYQAQWWPDGDGGSLRDGTFRFRCPVCRLDLKRRAEWVAEVFRGAVDAGMRELDASRLT